MHWDAVTPTMENCLFRAKPCCRIGNALPSQMAISFGSLPTIGNNSGARPVHHFSHPSQSRSLPSRSRSRISSAPWLEISAARRSLRITTDSDSTSLAMVLSFGSRYSRFRCSSRPASLQPNPSLLSRDNSVRGTLRVRPLGVHCWASWPIVRVETLARAYEIYLGDFLHT